MCKQDEFINLKFKKYLDYIISKGVERNSKISNLHIQSILYCIGVYSKDELWDGVFQLCTHNPINLCVYLKIKNNGIHNTICRKTIHKFSVYDDVMDIPKIFRDLIDKLLECKPWEVSGIVYDNSIFYKTGKSKDNGRMIPYKDICKEVKLYDAVVNFIKENNLKLKD